MSLCIHSLYIELRFHSLYIELRFSGQCINYIRNYVIHYSSHYAFLPFSTEPVREVAAGDSSLPIKKRSGPVIQWLLVIHSAQLGGKTALISPGAEVEWEFGTLGFRTLATLAPIKPQSSSYGPN